MQNTLIDAGPMISLFNRDDKYHSYVLKFIKQFNGKLLTTWPVITEAAYMLNFNINVQIDFLEWLKRDAVTIVNLKNEQIERIIQLLKKYSDVPMDLADSSLIVVAELIGINDVISIDKDYYIYRTRSKKALNNLLLNFINNES